MWKEILKNNLQSIDDLIDFTKLNIENVNLKINIPKRLAAKIKKKDDPIYLQFIPKKEELKKNTGFVKEPTQDSSFQKNCLLQKYQNRALLLCNPNCAMFCRFCFRKYFTYPKVFDKEFAIIKKNKYLEIILSGGDPLTLDNKNLENIFNKLNSIKTLKRIRIHTRMPIGIPERIDNGFLKILKNSSKQIIFVIHVNHQLELDKDILYSLSKIQKLKIPILSQTVLLKNVNDNVQSLFDLFEALSSNGIIPYYLHQLDKVLGTKHFQVTKNKGKKIIQSLRKLCSGYSIPLYVEEISHEKNKTIIYP